MIDKDNVVKHWKETSQEDLKTMLTLFNSKSYNWSLFLGHISIEKILKAVYVSKYGEHAPFTHNLLRIAEQCKLDLSDEYSDWLDIITTFNLNARYDDYLREFYRQCTPEFTKLWIDKITTLHTWINQKL